MACDRCDGSRRAGMRFCPYCGEPLAVAEGPRAFTLRDVAALSLPVVAVLLVLEVAYLVGSLGTVWDWCADARLGIYALIPNLVTVTTISGTALQLFWVVTAAAILLSVIALVWRSVGQSKGEGTLLERLERTDLYRTSSLFCACTAISFIMSLALMSTGNGIEVPEDMVLGNTAAALFAYADAAFWEEIIARVLWIGVPMTAAALILRRGAGSLRLLLGGFGMSRLSVALIVISAAIFGFAHMEGWGLEKVLPTTLSGLVIGYAYVRVGLHAAIGIHFLTDYLAVVAYTGLLVPVALLTWAILILGVVCLALIVYELRLLPGRLRDMPDWLPDRDSSLSSEDSD